MPESKYLKLVIGDNQVEVTDASELPVSIDYSLEDPDNYQDKPSSEALSLEVPATLMNEKAANTFRQPDVMDLTEGEVFRGNQSFVIDENGYEIMKGKAFLRGAKHNDRPVSYKFDLFGDNADWKVDLEEATLYEFLKHITFTFSNVGIMASWSADGQSESLPYVFAPVKYRGPMGGIGNDGNPIDDIMTPTYMKPSLFLYWILYWGFKSVGYRIESNFLQTEYFRRLVMPWTWGAFLESDGTRLDTLAFLAKSTERVENFPIHGHDDVIWDLKIGNDSTDGAFDNNDSYTWDPVNREAIWKYKPPQYGVLEAHFECSLMLDIELSTSSVFGSGMSECEIAIMWFKNDVPIDGDPDPNYNGEAGLPSVVDGVKTLVVSSLLSDFTWGTNYHKATYNGIRTMRLTTLVDPADNGGTGTKISFKIFRHAYRDQGWDIVTRGEVLEFKTSYFKIPMGGTIDFANYTAFKNYKFLDLLRGTIDMFNMSVNTDPVSKVVYIEPTHSYSLTTDQNEKKEGYFKNDFISWEGKQDLSQTWEMENYRDYDREVTFSFKDDPQDGLLRKIQNRLSATVGAGKYVFPERFKAGKRTVENRFFSPVVHYQVDAWKKNGTGVNAGITPQMVAIVQENISNTSSGAPNAFNPKLCYYKGLVEGVGAWIFPVGFIPVRQTYPYMFAVNYQPGGEEDPILSYCDEKIPTADPETFVIGKGLLQRFFWQRLAIMRNGQWYNTWFRLKNSDVVDMLHREYKAFGGHRWELIKITGYKPLKDESTACLLRRWAPVGAEEAENTFPSADSILDDNSHNPLDMKYIQAMALATDIPKLDS
jgi:hypothetical protein